jgi:imidazoleglycerol-phosphate dehydratase
MSRQAHVTRTTRETDVRVELNLDGQGAVNLATGIPFLDHMLHLFAAHGYFDLTVKAKGRPGGGSAPHRGGHRHLPGAGLPAGPGPAAGVRRYGSARVPMDEALAQATVDLSNRPFLHLDVRLRRCPRRSTPNCSRNSGGPWPSTAA